MQQPGDDSSTSYDQVLGGADRSGCKIYVNSQSKGKVITEENTS